MYDANEPTASMQQQHRPRRRSGPSPGPIVVVGMIIAIALGRQRDAIVVGNDCPPRSVSSRRVLNSVCKEAAFANQSVRAIGTAMLQLGRRVSLHLGTLFKSAPSTGGASRKPARLSIQQPS